MSLFWDFLLATALIAAFVLFRLVADRYLLRRRIASGEIGRNCASGACQQSRSQSAAPSTCSAESGGKLLKRSASHAP